MGYLEGRRKGMEELCEINSGAVLGGWDELVGWIKMATSNLVGVGGRGRFCSTRTFQQELKGSW